MYARITITIPDALLKKLDRIAKKLYMTRSAFIRMAIRDAIDEETAAEKFAREQRGYPFNRHLKQRLENHHFKRGFLKILKEEKPSVYEKMVKRMKKEGVLR